MGKNPKVVERSLDGGASSCFSATGRASSFTRSLRYTSTVLA